MHAICRDELSEGHPRGVPIVDPVRTVGRNGRSGTEVEHMDRLGCLQLYQPIHYPEIGTGVCMDE